MKEKEIIVIRENLIQAFISDLMTFGFLGGTLWFNYNFIGGSYFMNGILLVMFLMLIVGRFNTQSKKFSSSKEAIDYLKKCK